MIRQTLSAHLFDARFSLDNPEITGEFTEHQYNILINSVSFSHFTLFISLDEPIKRRFYDVECVKGNWSVRELKRQINSLYFERSALSRDKRALSDHVQTLAEADSPPSLDPGPLYLRISWTQK